MHTVCPLKIRARASTLLLVKCFYFGKAKIRTRLGKRCVVR